MVESKISNLVKDLLEEIFPTNQITNMSIKLTSGIGPEEKIIDGNIEEKYPNVLSLMVLSKVFQEILKKAMEDNSIGVRDYKWLLKISDDLKELFWRICEFKYGDFTFDIRDMDGNITIVKTPDIKTPLDFIKMKFFGG